MLLDRHGQPLPPSGLHRESTARAVQIGGGQLPASAAWQEPGWYEGRPGDTTPHRSAYGITRKDARRVCRTLYHTNGLFQVAVDIASAMLVGDTLSYGNVADPALQEVIDDLWQVNSLGSLMSQRVMAELFLDGELAAVFPQGQTPPDVPARLALLDVDTPGLKVEADTARGALPADMVTRLRVDRMGQPAQVWEEGEFVWTASGALHNDPRGWPLAKGAADAAVAYIAMLNMRLNIHHVQQRLLAVYRAIMDPAGKNHRGDPDGGIHDWRMKTSRFRELPERGGVLAIVERPGFTDRDGNKYEGVSESLDFMRPGQGASEAASDMRLILRFLGLAIGGLPEHWLGEGGNAARTTAASMSTPAVRLANQRQALVGDFLTRLVRTEARRRHGPDRLYRIQKGARKRKPVGLIEILWVFPAIRDESVDEIVKRVEVAMRYRLADPQTATADLGYDAAMVEERLARQPPPAPPEPPDDPPE